MTAEKRRQYGSGSVSKRSSDGRWIGSIQAGWTSKGKRRRITLTAKTEAECKRKVAAKLAEIARTGVPIEGTNTRATVKSWAEQWLEHTQVQVRPKTWATNRSCVNKWIIPHIGHRRLDQLTPDAFHLVAKELRASGAAANTILRTTVVLKSMLVAAEAHGHVIPRHVLAFKTGKPAKSPRSDISIDIARSILTTADGLSDASRWYAAFHLGIRQGETLGLTWDCVNLRDGVVDVSWQLQALPYISGRAGALRVPDGYEVRRLKGALSLVRPKTHGSQRLMPLTGTLADKLRDWQAIAPPSEHGLVWSRSGDPIPSNEDREAWHILQTLAGVRHPSGRYYYLHEIRHTTATVMLEAGVPLEVIRAVLGHAEILTTLEYAHMSTELARQGMAKLAAALG
jgi:integrase